MIPWMRTVREVCTELWSEHVRIQHMQNGIELKIEEETDFYITVTAILFCKLA